MELTLPLPLIQPPARPPTTRVPPGAPRKEATDAASSLSLLRNRADRTDRGHGIDPEGEMENMPPGDSGDKGK